MPSKNTERSEEDYLRDHLSSSETKSSGNPTSPETTNNFNVSRTTDLQYMSVDAKQLPCGQFYPDGTTILVRPAQVKEIQSYSMVDDNNFYDIVEKMNDMLQSCVRVKYSTDKVASYLDIKDQDRLYLVFLIRELTFQSGNSLGVNVKCNCGSENQFELKRKFFRFHEVDEKISRYYDRATGSFLFRTVNNKEYRLTPPTIGLQKAFTEYIVKENNEKRPPNLAFLKIIPFMLEGRTSITYDGIKAKLSEFESMDDVSFQFLNSAVSKMAFGIKELVTMCNSCGLEIRTDMQFPNGASGIFVIHDAFETFVQK